MDATKNIKESMVAGAYNPDRTLSFIDQIVLELERLNRIGNISPVEYSCALDFARTMSKPLTNTFGRQTHGLPQALTVVLRQVRKRLSSF